MNDKKQRAVKDGRATVLVCEDEFVVALDLKLLIEEFGYEVMGPFAKRADAMEKLDEVMPDVALLDVRLKDGEVFPLADKLVDLGIPIVFHSGHIFEEDVRNRYPGAETCQKPVSAKHLRSTLDNAR